MPIVRNYNAPATLAGAVAFQAGQGQFKQRKDQFDQAAAMDAARLNLSALNADRQFLQNQQARNDAIVLRQQKMQQQAVQRQQELQMDQANREAQRQQQLQLEQMQQQGQQAYAKAQAEAWQARDQFGFNQEQVEKRASDAVLLSQAQALADEIGKYDLSERPDKKNERSEWMTQFRAMQSAAKLLQPGAISTPLAALIKDGQAKNFSQYEPQPFDMEAMIKEKVRYVNGLDMTQGAWTTEYRNGQVVPRFVPPPSQKANDKPDETPSMVQAKPLTPQEWDDRARKQLMDERRLLPMNENYSGEIKPPTHEEVRQRVAELQQSDAELLNGSKSAMADADLESLAAEAMQGMGQAAGFGQLPMAGVAESIADVSVPFQIPADMSDADLASVVANAPSGKVFIDPQTGQKFAKP